MIGMTAVVYFCGVIAVMLIGDAILHIAGWVADEVYRAKMRAARKRRMRERARKGELWIHY